MTGKIFISYRRSDSKAITDRIFAWLTEQFGRGTVFYDIDSIGPGEDWRAHIRDEVGKARVVLAIISGSWLAAMQERFADPKDVLRFELETALARGISVIPVLIERTGMPKAQELPVSLARLPDLNAATVHEARYFFTDMDALAERLAAGWGFERRIAAPAIAGKMRPATADLVVPSNFRGPALPPPKVGEKWEMVIWPKLVDKSWSRLLGSPKKPNFAMAAWLRPQWSGSKYRIAVCDRDRIGFVNFSEKTFEMKRPFTFAEDVGYPWNSDGGSLPTGLIYNFAAHGDGIVFASGAILCFQGGDGPLYRKDLWSGADKISTMVGEDYIISPQNAKGWWVYCTERIEGGSFKGYCCNVFQGQKRLFEYQEKCIFRNGSFDWAASGDYAIVSYPWGALRFVETKSIDGFKFREFSDSEGEKRTHLFAEFPKNNDSRYGRPVWHPVLDIFAHCTYRTERYVDGEHEASRACDWHLAAYDAASLGLVHAFSVEETDELRHVAWSATGRYLATGGTSRCIWVFDLLSGAVNKCFGHTNAIASLHFSPDGQRLLSCDGRKCIVWNPESGESVADWPGNVNFQVRESPWSPDGEMVATSGFEIRRLVV